MIVTGDDKEEISRLKDYLAAEFADERSWWIEIFLGYRSSLI